MSLILSIIGDPGVGKGCIAQRLKMLYEFNALSTGDLCRWHMKSKTDFGYAYQKALEDKTAVADNLVVQEVVHWIDKAMVREKFVLDGFPRTIAQSNFFNEIVSAREWLFVVVVLYARSDILRNRLQNRYTCLNYDCQKTYQIHDGRTFLCKVCGSQIGKRDDDSLYVDRRLYNSKFNIRRLVDYYYKRRYRLLYIDVSDRADDMVVDRIINFVRRYEMHGLGYY